MGIHELWQVVERIGQQQSLAKMAFEQLEISNKPNPCVEQGAVFGIDICPIMDAYIRSSQKHGLHHQGPLQLLFYRLAQYLEVPANFVFVYDGPNRPSVKRSSKVIPRKLWWEKPTKVLIAKFGFTFYNAPGEAEAELALLNRWGIIDAVITPDSDVFAFGGQLVLRTIPHAQKAFEDEAKQYSAVDMNGQLRLTADRVIFYALLAGGDYDKGAKGCGRQYAYRLAISGVGDSLVTSVRRSHTDGEAAAAIQQWRQTTNTALSSGQLDLDTRSRNNLSEILQNLQVPFPKLQVIQYYVHPQTDGNFDCRTWRMAPLPSLSGIAEFCREQLDWDDEVALLASLRSNVWEGAVLRLLCSNHCSWEVDPFTVGTTRYRVRIQWCKPMKRRGKFMNGRTDVQIAVHEEGLREWAMENGDWTEQHSDEGKEGLIKVYVPPKLVPEWALNRIEVSPEGQGIGSSAEKKTGTQILAAESLSSGMKGRKGAALLAAVETGPAFGEGSSAGVKGGERLNGEQGSVGEVTASFKPLAASSSKAASGSLGRFKTQAVHASNTLDGLEIDIESDGDSPIPELSKSAGKRKLVTVASFELDSDGEVIEEVGRGRNAQRFPSGCEEDSREADLGLDGEGETVEMEANPNTTSAADGPEVASATGHGVGEVIDLTESD